jgi:hypothetical protein
MKNGRIEGLETSWFIVMGLAFAQSSLRTAALINPLPLPCPTAVVKSRMQFRTSASLVKRVASQLRCSPGNNEKEEVQSPSVVAELEIAI